MFYYADTASLPGTAAIYKLVCIHFDVVVVVVVVFLILTSNMGIIVINSEILDKYLAKLQMKNVIHTRLPYIEKVCVNRLGRGKLWFLVAEVSRGDSGCPWL